MGKISHHVWWGKGYGTETVRISLSGPLSPVMVFPIQEITDSGVMVTPALAVDGEVKVAGRIPRLEEIKAWIRWGELPSQGHKARVFKVREPRHITMEEMTRISWEPPC